MHKGVYTTIFSSNGSDFVPYEPECPDELRATIQGTLLVHQHSPGRMRGLGVMKVTRVVGGRWFVVLNPHCGVQQGGFNMFL